MIEQEKSNKELSNNRQKLENIRQRISGKKAKKNDIYNRICETINYCGGYKQFLDTPICILIQMSKVIDNIKDEQSKLLGGTKLPKVKKH